MKKKTGLYVYFVWKETLSSRLMSPSAHDTNCSIQKNNYLNKE